MCSNCRDNFYNGNNDLGTKECWSYCSAEVVMRIKIPVHLRPPYSIPANWTLSCHKPPGYVQVKPEVLTPEGYWKS